MPTMIESATIRKILHPIFGRVASWLGPSLIDCVVIVLCLTPFPVLQIFLFLLVVTIKPLEIVSLLLQIMIQISMVLEQSKEKFLNHIYLPLRLEKLSEEIITFLQED